jgi:hypothetical protein
MFFRIERCGAVRWWRGVCGQDSGELFKEFGFEAEPGLRTFRMLIDTIFCNVIVSSGEVALPLKYLKFV